MDKSTGKAVLETSTTKYKVIYAPQQAEKLIRSYYLAPYTGIFVEWKVSIDQYLEGSLESLDIKLLKY